MENLLLAALSDPDQRLLTPHLREISLEQHHVLHQPGDTISACYFPTTAVISLVVILESGETIEAALIGRDGVLGASSALDGRLSLNRASVQLSGRGLLCAPADLKKAALQSPSLLSALIRHEQTLYVQAQQSAACNIKHSVEARLARWMLRARDLAATDTLPFTQEFLAEMLGVARTSVSLVAHTLQQAGVINYSRGRIHISNLDGLREIACECYGTIKAHHDSLLGNGKASQR
jgi:CRP-like cAMP-binding protein